MALWRNCSLDSEDDGRRLRQLSFVASYRLGDGVLRLLTDDRALAERFEQVFGECAVAAGIAPALTCFVTAAPDHEVVRVEFDRPLADVAPYLAFIFPERHYSAEARQGWHVLLTGSEEIGAVASHGSLLLSRFPGWQSFAANAAVALLMRLQPHVLFFHAAVSDVSGRGVFISGAKSSGKTTTSLALAARGHPLLSDEVGAIRRESWEAVPFRRAVSIRDGVRAERVELALRSAGDVATEFFPDGQRRIRIAASALFADEPGAVPLHSAFFLRGFASRPRIEPLRRVTANVQLLQPLGCTLWNNNAPSTTMDLLRFFEKTRCYHLDAGPPDETALAIEKLLEASCP